MQALPPFSLVEDAIARVQSPEIVVKQEGGRNDGDASIAASIGSVEGTQIAGCSPTPKMRIFVGL